jgi:positive regulator of sigma E activity
MASFIRHKPKLLAAFMFYVSGLLQFISAYLEDNVMNIIAGILMIAAGTLFVVGHKRKNKDKRCH